MNRATKPILLTAGSVLVLTAVLLALRVSNSDILLGEKRFEVLPPSIPLKLSLKQDELPGGYELVTDDDTLKEMRLEQNPGYMILPAEQAALANRGGLCSIAAMYIHEGELRLMMNGVYFRNAEMCEKFIQTESEKDLHMAAFRKTLPSSVWILMIASDQEQAYTEREREQFKDMLDRYQRRLRLEPLFDNLSETP